MNLNAYLTIASALLDETTFEAIRGSTRADLRVGPSLSHCNLPVSETFYRRTSHCSGRHAGRL